MVTGFPGHNKKPAPEPEPKEPAVCACGTEAEVFYAPEIREGSVVGPAPPPQCKECHYKDTDWEEV